MPSVEDESLSSVMAAIQEMSQDRGHLFWTEGDILWGIEEDWVVEKHWRHRAEVGATCLCSLHPVQGDVYSLFINTFSDILTDQYNFHVRPS